MSEPLVGAQVIADLLGVSDSLIYDLCRRNRIPHYRVGGRLKFRQSEIEAWLTEQRAG